jgi:hypothetical protein
MASPPQLIENYHAVTCAGAVLLKPWEEGDLWEDYLEDGAEPSLTRQSVIAAPDVAGVTNGALFHRGNTRYTATIRRRAYFGCGVTFPLTVPASPAGALAGLTFTDAFDMAQQWLVRHIKTLPDAKGALVWNGQTWASAAVEVSQATTDGPFAILTYQITASEG